MHSGPEHSGAGALARPALELQDIVRAHGAALARTRALTPEQARTLRAIERCRTAALGGHLDVCTASGHTDPSYNSCRDRHCPKCQWLAQARWVQKRTPKRLGALLGVTAVLHTWTRDLRFHPHVHCIVTGGG